MPTYVVTWYADSTLPTRTWRDADSKHGSTSSMISRLMAYRSDMMDCILATCWFGHSISNFCMSLSFFSMHWVPCRTWLLLIVRIPFWQAKCQKWVLTYAPSPVLAFEYIWVMLLSWPYSTCMSLHKTLYLYAPILLQSKYIWGMLLTWPYLICMPLHETLHLLAPI